MFRRLSSGLPKDPVYPTDLERLGYFINEKDEIRSLENPKAYFKFFLTKNDRYNSLQRESMNEFVRNLIAQRLEALSLEKTRLPLGVSETEPNIPIFVSSDLKSKSRIIILFYEPTQDLGVFAHRIIGGKGGINAGSAVDFVKHIRTLESSPSDASSPGIILANMGQMRWWRRGKKAVTQTSWYALPQKSAVDDPFRFDALKNTVEGNRTSEEHVEYIFNEVVDRLVHKQARINLIGVSEGAVRLSEFLQGDGNWKMWGDRIDAFASVATWFHKDEITNKKFSEWFRARGRAYLTGPEPNGVFLAGPDGVNKKKMYIPAHGCPCFSLGEPYYTESMLPKGYKTVLSWFQEVSRDGSCYENPEFQRLDDDDSEDDAAEADGWTVEGVEKGIEKEGQVGNPKLGGEAVDDSKKESRPAKDENTGVRFMDLNEEALGSDGKDEVRFGDVGGLRVGKVFEMLERERIQRAETTGKEETVESQDGNEGSSGEKTGNPA